MMSDLVFFSALGAFSPSDELAFAARVDFLHELCSRKFRVLSIGDRDRVWELLASLIAGEVLPPINGESYAVLYGDDVVATNGYCYVKLDGEWREVPRSPQPSLRITSGWLLVSADRLETSEMRRLSKLVAENPVPEVAAKLIGEEERFPVALAAVRSRIPLGRLSGFKAMWCATDRGMVRGNNEDGVACASFRVSSGGINQCYRLLAVADGAGGHGHGEIASMEALSEALYRTAETVLTQSEIEEEQLRDIVLLANMRVIQARQTRRSNMASTLTMTLVVNSAIFTAHVGDSRAYYVDKKSIEQLTEDHKYVEELVKKGIITRQQARVHPQKNIITSALGMAQPRIDVAHHPRSYSPGVRLLVCSDGLSDLLEDWEIHRIVADSISPSQAADRLVHLANSRGGYDNISVALDFFL